MTSPEARAGGANAINNAAAVNNRRRRLLVIAAVLALALFGLLSTATSGFGGPSEASPSVRQAPKRSRRALLTAGNGEFRESWRIGGAKKG